MVIVLIVFLFVVSPSVYATDELPQYFKELLERTQMTFTMPEGYIETEQIKNPHMQWEYSIKHPTEKFEIRYAIRPIDKMIKKFEEWKKNPKEGGVKTDPRNIYPSIAASVAYNIGDGYDIEKVMSGLIIFPAESVKKEFGADKGVHMTLLKVRKEFANDYNHCMMVAINKEDLGTAFCFFMFDDINILSSTLPLVFYSLRFK